MRKNFMLSLVAMAALPMAGLADAYVPGVGDGKWQIKDQEGEVDLSDEGLLISTDGSTITKEVTLVPGEYSVTAETLNNAAVLVNVGGNAYPAGTRFRLTEQTTITITLSSNDGSEFSVGGVKVTLHYDFAATQSDLSTKLSAAYGKISDNSGDEWEQELFDQYTATEGLMNQVFAIDDMQENSYTIYCEQELYLGVDNSKIGKAIQAYSDEIDACIANKEAYNDTKNDLKTLEYGCLNDMQQAFDNAVCQETKDFYKDDVVALAQEVETYKAGLETAYTDREAVEYTEVTNKGWFESINSRIADVRNRIAYFDAVKKVVLDATACYDEKVEQLIKDIDAEGPYAAILSNAKETLANDYKPVGEVDAFINDKTKNPQDKYDANIAQVSAAKQAIQDSYNLYKARLDDYSAAYKEWNGLKARVNGVSNDLAAIGNEEYAGDIAKINVKLAAIEKLFVDGMKEDVDVPEWSTQYTEVNDLILALENASYSTIANYNAYKEMLEATGDEVLSLQTLKEKLQAVDEALATYVSEDEAYSAANFWTLSEGISGAINDLKALVEDAYTNGDAVNFKSSFRTHAQPIEDAIDKYATDSEQAFENYKTITGNLTDWKAKLETIRGFVGNTKVSHTFDSGVKTYAQAIAETVQTITGLEAGLQTAMGEQNDVHSNALAALAQTAEPELLSIDEDTYKEDLKDYNDNAAVDAAKNLAGEVMDKKDEVETALEELQDAFYAITDHSELGLRYQTIKDQLAAWDSTLQNMQIAKADDITKDNAIATQKELYVQWTDLNKIAAGIKDINLEKIKNEVKENKTQYDALVTNFDALLEKIDKINLLNADGTIQDDTYTQDDSHNQDTSKSVYFDGKESELRTELGTLTSGLDAAYAYETVIAEGWETKCNEFTVKVDGVIAEADAATANYNAYNELLALIGSEFTVELEDGTKDLIEQEREEVKAVGELGNAGQTYFLGVLDGRASELDGLNAKIVGEYEAGTADDNLETLKGKITALAEEVKNISDHAQANEDNHNNLVAKKAETLTYWETIYNQLSAEDQTSQMITWLDQLRDIEIQINTTGDEVDAAFAMGELSAEDSYNTFVDTYEGYKTKVSKISADWNDPTGYLANLIKENAKRHSDFQTALQDARTAFNVAVTSLAKFENITDEELQVAFDKVISANKTLYTYNDILRQLEADEKEEYDRVFANNNPTKEDVEPARDAFDLQEEFRAKAVTYKAEIESLYQQTTAQLNATSAQLLDAALDAAETAVNDAESAIADYHDDVTEGAFSEEKELIAQGRGMFAANGEVLNPELAVELANGFLAEVRGIVASVAEECEELAQKEYKLDKGELQVYDDNARAFLRENSAPENVTFDYKQAYEDAYAKYIDADGGFNSVGELYADGGMFETGLAIAKQALTDFYRSNYFDEFKQKVSNKKLSDAAYDDLQVVIGEIQDIIDEAQAYANQYVLISCSHVDIVQQSLNDVIEYIEKRKADGTVHSNRFSIDSSLSQIKLDAKGLKYDSDKLEKSELFSQIDLLRYEYNQAVAAGVVDADDQIKYEDLINGYDDQLGQIDVTDDELDAVALLALEGEIAAKRTDVTILFGETLIPNLYNELKTLAEEVQGFCADTQAYLDNECHAPVQDQFADALAAYAAKADAAAFKIEEFQTAGTLLFYSESQKTILKDVKAAVEQMREYMEKADEPYDVNDEVVARLKEELAGYVARYNALDEKLKGYEHCNYQSFYQETGYLRGLFTEDQLRLDAAEDYRNLLTEDAKLLYIDYYDSHLDSFDWQYSYNEALWRVQNVFSEFEDAEKEIYDYDSAINMDELERMSSTIYKYRWYLRKFNEDSHSGIIVCDIDGNLFYNEWGYRTSKSISRVAYVEECVPAVFERCEELLEQIAEFRQLIIDSRYIVGDVNRDKEVLVDDYTTILFHTLGHTLIEEEVRLAAADANYDGEVNIGDLTAVARIITGADSQPEYVPSRVRSSMLTSTDNVYVSIEGEGVHQRIGIFVDASRLYAGAQMDIKLPEGVSLVAETTGARAEGFALNSHELEKGVHRFVLSSLEGLTFAENGDALIWLDVQVDHNYNGQDIEVSNILFSDSMAHVFSLSALQGESTGLGTVSVTEEVKDKIYNVGGILMDGLKRGVNIIRGNDGSAKKVIIK